MRKRNLSKARMERVRQNKKRARKLHGKIMRLHGQSLANLVHLTPKAIVNERLAAMAIEFFEQFVGYLRKLTKRLKNYKLRDSKNFTRLRACLVALTPLAISIPQAGATSLPPAASRA